MIRQTGHFQYQGNNTFKNKIIKLTFTMTDNNDSRPQQSIIMEQHSNILFLRFNLFWTGSNQTENNLMIWEARFAVSLFLSKGLVR